MSGSRLVYGVILIALMTAGPAAAQSRNGNVWDGVAHQPNALSIRSGDKAKGILASPREQTRQDDILDRLAREMLERSGR
jgi:hypothetical protein